MSAEDAPVGAEVVLAQCSDALPLLLARLALPAQRRAGEVSSAWRDASGVVSAGSTELDLRPYAQTLSDASLAALLAQSPNLRTLNVAGCTRLSDAGLAHLATAVPQLTELNLSCVHGLSADGVAQAIAGLDGLASLDLAGCTGIGASELVARFGAYLELDDDEDGLSKVQG